MALTQSHDCFMPFGEWALQASSYSCHNPSNFLSSISRTEGNFWLDFEVSPWLLPRFVYSISTRRASFVWMLVAASTLPSLSVLTPVFSYASLSFAPISSTQWSEWILVHNVAGTSYHSQSENSRSMRIRDPLCLPWTSTVTFSLLSHFCPYSPLAWTHQPSSCFPRSPESSCPRTLTLRALLSTLSLNYLLLGHMPSDGSRDFSRKGGIAHSFSWPALLFLPYAPPPWRFSPCSTF